MKKSSEKKEGEKNLDEVEQLLQAAQDQLLLKLSQDSHLARPSPSAAASSNNYLDLDLDLDRRFQALKSSGPSVPIASPIHDQELKAVLGDDLSARFAALKAKSNPSSSPTAIAAKEVPFDRTLYNGEGEGEDEDDQVEKLIQWAKDAARLDPSPPSDDDAEDDDGDSESEETDECRKRK